MDTFLAIASRREVRDYADRQLPDEVVRRILEAARITGSASNRQQWTFLALGREARERAADAVYAPENLRGAALAVAIVMHGGPIGFDAGRAGQNMMLAAWNEGVGACPNGVSDPERLTQALQLGEDDRVVNIISFGYPARPFDPARRPPEEWLERANRKPFDEVVRWV